MLGKLILFLRSFVASREEMFVPKEDSKGNSAVRKRLQTDKDLWTNPNKNNPDKARPIADDPAAKKHFGEIEKAGRDLIESIANAKESWITGFLTEVWREQFKSRVPDRVKAFRVHLDFAPPDR